MYQMCTRCVMDTTASPISFDQHGVCNYCKEHEYKVSLTPSSKPDASLQLEKIISKIKADRVGEYDCIVGLSGGVDSSYVAYTAVKLGLKPLAVHFDNGWNSELAVQNIENIVKKLDLDLMTYVIDWPEFRDIQRSYFKANVIDIEMVTDHAIFAAMFKIARQQRIKYILSGTNAATESIMPRSWQHFKFDLLNLKSIHRKFGKIKIKNYPTLSIWKMGWLNLFGSIKSVAILNYLDYSKSQAMNVLSNELDWQYYGGKHYESTFTKFYQSHILPDKFGVDKRKLHLSDLILNGELSREAALRELDKPLYISEELQRDTQYVIKKLGFSEHEFKRYMAQDPVSHFAYPSYAKIATYVTSIYKRHRYS
jgi:N-acetyl sugar amidotransferase